MSSKSPQTAYKQFWVTSYKLPKTVTITITRIKKIPEFMLKIALYIPTLAERTINAEIRRITYVAKL